MVTTPRQMSDDPHFARVVAAAGAAVRARGLELSVHLVGPAVLHLLAPFTGDRRFAGAITVNVTTQAASIDRRRSCPVVSLGASVSDVPFVEPDNAGGAQAAVRHFVALGRSNIGMIAGPPTNPCALERTLGFLHEMQRCGRRAVVEFTDFTREQAEEATHRILSRVPETDALFVASDLMASGTLRALKAAGRSVPDECAVVGFDNVALARSLMPALTTIHQPVEEIVEAAVGLLERAPFERRYEQRLPTSLVVRESSGALC